MISNRIGFIITFTWILSLLAALLPFTGWRQITNRTEGGFCQYHLNLDITYILFLHVTVCVVPITVTCAAYCQIFRVAERQATKIANTEVSKRDVIIGSHIAKTTGNSYFVVYFGDFSVL